MSDYAWNRRQWFRDVFECLTPEGRVNFRGLYRALRSAGCDRDEARNDIRVVLCVYALHRLDKELER